MIPFFVYYSMFGFQRIGDFIWAAADMRAKGFLIGCTAGRTTLNGEGLQHQDGHSLLNAIAYPTVRAYDVAYAYESTVIIMQGLKRLYQDGDTAIYYLTCENEAYPHPALPEGAEEGIVRGMYEVSQKSVDSAVANVNLFGSGAILREVLRAQEILADRYKISSSAWSVTSYTQLQRDARACERWNMLHPDRPPRTSFLQESLQDRSGVFVSATDYVCALAEQIRPWVPGDYFCLGTDGMGRSETREALRRYFEVDAEFVVIATLYRLSQQGLVDQALVSQAIKDMNVAPDKIDPLLS